MTRHQSQKLSWKLSSKDQPSSKPKYEIPKEWRCFAKNADVGTVNMNTVVEKMNGAPSTKKLPLDSVRDDKNTLSLVNPPRSTLIWKGENANVSTYPWQVDPIVRY